MRLKVFFRDSYRENNEEITSYYALKSWNSDCIMRMRRCDLLFDRETNKWTDEIVEITEDNTGRDSRPFWVGRREYREEITYTASIQKLELRSSSVTYWPSTEPSIKRCTCVNKQRNSWNRCIRLKISEYHLDPWTWLNSVQMHTPTGTSNYITRCHRRLEGVRVWQFERVGVRVAVPVGERMPAEWEPALDRGLGLSGPTVEQPSRMRKKCCYGQKKFGSICSSLSPSPTHL